MTTNHRISGSGHDRALFYTLVSTVTGALLLLAAGCGRAIQESKLIGSWEDQGMPGVRKPYTGHTNTIYTLKVDHTVVVTRLARGRSFGSRGTWKLHRGRLIMTFTEEITRQGRIVPLPKLAPFDVPIAEVTDSTLVLSGGSVRKGIELKKVTFPPEAERTTE